ncbi:tetratricopeptide repeat protein [Falsiroseomonas sp. E2-1-a20]|uniref:tetratricopeptide repeat protein n=1 Tax=Falsiroseomonas sp. E2-1-a20 TaxID=3239300 RepID=UPI003F3A60B6
MLTPRGPSSFAHPTLRGKIERLEGHILVGWALNPQQPEQALEFEIEVNGQMAGRHVADILRGDLLRNGIGTGRHGFRVELPRELVSGDGADIVLSALPGRQAADATFTFQKPAVDSVAVEASPPPAARNPSPVLPPMVPRPARPLATALPRPGALAALQPLVAPALVAVPSPGAPPSIPRVEPRLSSAVQEAVSRLTTPPVAPVASRIAEALTARDWLAATAEAEVAAPRDVRIVLAHGVGLLEQGRAEEAEAVLRWLEDGAQEDHAALYRLGTALEAQQRHAEAAGIYGRCRVLKPTEPLYVLQCGRMMALAANGGMGVAPEYPELLDIAIAMLREAAAMMRRDGRPLRDLAGLLMQRGEVEAALEAMEEAERREPARPAYPLERARILTRLDRVEEALAAARRGVELAPASDAALAASRVLERWVAARQTSSWRLGVLADPTPRG